MFRRGAVEAPSRVMMFHRLLAEEVALFLEPGPLGVDRDAIQACERVR